MQPRCACGGGGGGGGDGGGGGGGDGGGGGGGGAPGREIIRHGTSHQETPNRQVTRIEQVTTICLMKKSPSTWPRKSNII